MTTTTERMTLTTLATIIMIVMVSFTAHGDEPLQADSLTHTRRYPEARRTNGGAASPTRCSTP